MGKPKKVVTANIGRGGARKHAGRPASERPIKSVIFNIYEDQNNKLNECEVGKSVSIRGMLDKKFKMGAYSGKKKSKKSN